MARIIKSGENSDASVYEKMNRSRIIDKDTFNAQLVAREILSEAENDEHAKLESACKLAEQVEEEAYQAAMESTNRVCLADLIRTYRDLESLSEVGRREVQELSQEIIHKIAGDGIEIPEGSGGLAARTLRIEASAKYVHELNTLQLPSWVEPRESTRADPGKLIIETDTFMIQCSFEEIVTCILPYNTLPS
jgi:hypothetical protein